MDKKKIWVAVGIFILFSLIIVVAVILLSNKSVITAANIPDNVRGAVDKLVAQTQAQIAARPPTVAVTFPEDSLKKDPSCAPLCESMHVVDKAYQLFRCTPPLPAAIALGARPIDEYSKMILEKECGFSLKNLIQPWYPQCLIDVTNACMDYRDKEAQRLKDACYEGCQRDGFIYRIQIYPPVNVETPVEMIPNMEGVEVKDLGESKYNAVIPVTLKIVTKVSINYYEADRGSADITLEKQPNPEGLFPLKNQMEYVIGFNLDTQFKLGDQLTDITAVVNNVQVQKEVKLTTLTDTFEDIGPYSKNPRWRNAPWLSPLGNDLVNDLNDLINRDINNFLDLGSIANNFPKVL